MEFKLVVDILSSLAALVAIVVALAAWYRSARRPLQIDRIVIHRKEQASTFILLVRNVKSDPVTIKRVGCYKRKKHQVQRKHGSSPEYSATFSSADMVFDAPGEFEVLPNGSTDVRVQASGASEAPGALLFLLHTTHGFHELWCRDITEVEVGKANVYNVEYQHDYDSAWRAKVVFYWKRFLFGVRSTFRRRSR